MPYVSTDLTGQVAFVTGTTSGLGRRFAKVLAACGAKVAATGRRVERLEALAEEIRAEGGVCEPIAIDMTSRDSIRGALSQAREKLGVVQILVNNAGIPDAQRAVKMSDELTDAVFNTNLVGPWVLSCEVAKGLIEAELPAHCEYCLCGRVQHHCPVGRDAVFNHQERRGAYDRISCRRVVSVSNQRQLYCPRRVFERDDGWDA